MDKEFYLEHEKKLSDRIRERRITCFDGVEAKNTDIKNSRLCRQNAKPLATEVKQDPAEMKLTKDDILVRGFSGNREASIKNSLDRRKEKEGSEIINEYWRKGEKLRSYFMWFIVGQNGRKKKNKK